MSVHQWRNPTTADIAKALARRGIRIIGPTERGAGNFPIADICEQYGDGLIPVMRAYRLVRPYAPDKQTAEDWLRAAKQPAMPGYGSWDTRRHDPVAEVA